LQVVTWTTGDPLSGSPVTAGDVEFTIEQQDGEEMVVVAEPKAKTVKGAPAPAPAPATALEPPASGQPYVSVGHKSQHAVVGLVHRLQCSVASL
jgi:hypothetical protein